MLENERKKLEKEREKLLAVEKHNKELQQRLADYEETNRKLQLGIYLYFKFNLELLKI